MTAPEAPLLLVGTDHRSAGLECRERVSYDAAAAEDLLVELLAKPNDIEEAILLSTCNRTEIYVRPVEVDGALDLALDLVFANRAPEIKEEGRYYVKHGQEAARHLLAVSAGIKSMVLGEPEILGQVRRAVQLAEATGASGSVIGRLGRCALAAGRRARAETAIGEGPVSYSYATVELASSVFKSLEQCSVLTIGAGETGTAVSRGLLERGVRRIKVANRTHQRALEFRREFPAAEIVPFEDRGEALVDADLVVTATGAPESILSRDTLAASMRCRQDRPLLIVDLGVPRDVDPRAGELPNLFLHDLGSLEELIHRTVRERRSEVPAVGRIVEEELARFEAWLGNLAALPVVADLHRRAEHIRQREIETHREEFPTETHHDLEALTRSIVRKLLHHPSTRLREYGDAVNLDHMAAFRNLFQLDADP